MRKENIALQAEKSTSFRLKTSALCGAPAEIFLPQAGAKTICFYRSIATFYCIFAKNTHIFMVKKS